MRSIGVSMAESTAVAIGAGDGHTHPNKDILDMLRQNPAGYLTFPNEDAVPVSDLLVEKSITLGGGVLKWDDTEKAFYVETLNGGKAGFYASGFVSAKGVGSSSGGGGGVDALSLLVDVALSSPVSGQVLTYNGTHWVNRDAAAGGLTEVRWGDILDKPTTFAPSAHTHTKAQITDFAHTHTRLEPKIFASMADIDFSSMLWSHNGTSLQGNSMGMALVVNFGVGYGRAFQLWNSRNDPTLYWRPAKYDMSGFDVTHALLDNKNFNTYAAAVNHTHTKANITDFAHTHNSINGNYTGNGGFQPPNYFGRGLWLQMMNNLPGMPSVSTYYDMLVCNSYISDVHICNTLAMSKDGNGYVYVLSQNQNNAAWTNKGRLAYITDNVASATNADKLDGVHWQNILERTSSGHGAYQSVGWYRIAETLMTRAKGANFIMYLNKMYNYGGVDTFIFNISIPYSGAVSITQVSGAKETSFLTKIRVIRRGVSDISHIEFYISADAGGYNEYFWTVVGQATAYTSAQYNINDGGTYTEFAMGNGLRTNQVITAIDSPIYAKGGTLTNTAIRFNLNGATPLGENYIRPGNGDGASFSKYNIEIRAWYGIGITNNIGTCSMVIDARAGSLFAAGAITAKSTSDLRLKANFNLSIDYRQRLLSLGRVVDFDYNELGRSRAIGAGDDKRHTGVIWQEAVKAGITGFATMDDDGYGSINPICPDFLMTMCGALQQTIKATDRQEDEIKRLKERVEELEKNSS